MKGFVWIAFVIITAPMLHAQQVCPSGNTRNAPDNRYGINANGTVRDSATNLIWKQCSEGQTGSACSGNASEMSWQNALKAASASNLASFSDWRLPSSKELQSLMEYGCYMPSINLTVFPNTPSTFHWSSTSYADGVNNAWGVYFNIGNLSNITKTGTGHVRLVRGGQ